MVDLGDAPFILGMAIQQNLDAGTTLLTQEGVVHEGKASKIQQADAHATKSPAEVGPMSTYRGGGDPIAGRNYDVPTLSRVRSFGPLHLQGIEAGRHPPGTV